MTHDEDDSNWRRIVVVTPKIYQGRICTSQRFGFNPISGSMFTTLFSLLVFQLGHFLCHSGPTLSVSESQVRSVWYIVNRFLVLTSIVFFRDDTELGI